MTADPASLSRLHDIIVPEPLPWWPPAPGWLWLLGITLLVAVFLLIKGVIRWQRTRYRREALIQLVKLEQLAATHTEQARALLGLSELLKRTALTAYPRPEVATLTGSAWFEFLDQRADTSFGSGLGAALEEANYRINPDRWEAVKVNQLVVEVRRWVKHHRPPSDQDGATQGHRDATEAPFSSERNVKERVR